MADVLEVGTIIHVPQADVYAFLRDVEGYEAYSGYVQDVTRRGDGGVGTEYDIGLAWWKLSYSLHVRVTDLEPPECIAWRVTTDLDANGAWNLAPTDVDDPDVDHATRVTLTARYDPDTADDDALSLPALVPMSTVVERARPVVEREAERILARVVADLEDEPRRATLTVHTRSDAE